MEGKSWWSRQWLAPCPSCELSNTRSCPHREHISSTLTSGVAYVHPHCLVHSPQPLIVRGPVAADLECTALNFQCSIVVVQCSQCSCIFSGVGSTYPTHA